ncbi:MAG: site-specific DNA-methyltransferase [[Clostridium] aminophilum]|uniref:DNA-methyltransferase n=1 Tax=[Clostridium] aminophilum TaxID=1526 RepID=UPI0026F37309|nr:site-specific DNA-methyltransferase [[Clostridium] aminophilum]MDD6196534.1 site-specific DNA-methyltransferase [[Clostridium] aminophilum]
MAVTTHKLIVGNSNNVSELENESVNLIITSPPYPMIEMWDDMFAKQDNGIEIALKSENGIAAFESMHRLLDNVWNECDRLLKRQGFICINIGDATRTINGKFQMYSNHARIIQKFSSMGYSVLPDIHWRKQSNAPNKFMGSGMYPAGAYVTYEHEYILIFRKGGKRLFKGEEKDRRQKSAYFWEERNIWFSDLWEIKGTSQGIGNSKKTRDRSAAYPFEIPYRLVNMYSVEGDVVLDPFSGIGTTTLACMASNRNSIGVEIDEDIAKIALDNIVEQAPKLNNYVENRISKHIAFINGLSDEKKEACYINENHGFPVKTRQEVDIRIDELETFKRDNDYISCEYKPIRMFDQLTLF